MESEIKKNRPGRKWILLFLLIMSVFIFFRYQISHFNAVVLNKTDNIPIPPADTIDLSSEAMNVTGNSSKVKSSKKKKKRGRKNKKSRNNASTSQNAKRKVVDKPKTPTPVITYFPKNADKHFNEVPPLPRLRLFNGNEWKKEKTEIRLTTDGEKLYIDAKLYDHNPEGAISRFSIERGGAAAWRDDSIGIFMMRNQSSEFYVQYNISVSGLGKASCFSNKSPLKRNIKFIRPPKGFIRPKSKAIDFAKGFRLRAEFNLKNIGITNFKPGNRMLIQVIRRYRGNRTYLQLFPVFIYASTKFGADSHNRHAFRPIQVVAPAKKAE